ncbi:Adhesion G-protein coupled receptor D1 [Exaiptasia diaphana]|nr:Adhesion G-protein coupled receptor D1 [Exaiptasia diaphana]
MNYIFAGFPSVFVIISLIVASTFEDGISSYTNQKFCWVSFSNGLIWTFVGPVILISMANIFILVFAIREIVNLNQGKLDQAEKFRQGVKSCVVLFPLLGLTWLFGLLAVTNAGIVFQYIFTILNSFQVVKLTYVRCRGDTYFTPYPDHVVIVIIMILADILFIFILIK